MFLKKGCFKCSERMRDFVNQRLNKKEKLILKEMCNNNGNHCITKFVSFISEKYGFSRTSVWYNLRKMKNSGLIVFGSSEEKGIKARITMLGLLIENSEMYESRNI